MPFITAEMLFENNVLEIIRKIESDNKTDIQRDFDEMPNLCPDLITWMERNPAAVGKAFTQHIINYGFTNEDIN